MEKIRVAIYGASGHGKVLAQIANSLGYKEVIFIDDGENDFLSFNEFYKRYKTDVPIVLGIGENRTREIIFNTIRSSGCRVLTLIDKSVLIGDDVEIGDGVVIMPGVIVNVKSSIGDGAILNSACVVEHECAIGAFVHISPNVSLAGGVVVDKYTHIGIGSCVIQNIKIGANTIVGAGSVIISDVSSDVVVAGNPIKKIRNIDE
jgi:UDP-N-acetylbacillosamine N-acetyltransferase